ncbi:MAG TPA: hypothetical protein VE913_10640 [Longimicrobium sp.]|nr:hypothetical protein [Longimicrobium sp.]
MTPAEAWLRERLADTPPELLDAMIHALPEDGEVADALAAGAMALYRAVLAGNGRREDAFPLLAADALFTHALEARAEADPDGVAHFAQIWGGAGKLGALAASG